MIIYSPSLRLNKKGKGCVPSRRTASSSIGFIPNALTIEAPTCDVTTGLFTMRALRLGFETINPTFVSAKLKPPCSAFFLVDPV